MAPRFDGENFTLELAVADLLDTRLQRSLGFANRGGYERMWLGQAIHSHYQEEALARDPTYRREVGLSTSFSHRGWEITIQGRADGLRKVADGSLVVEEIKSVRRDGTLTPAVRQLYEQQARLYAWLLNRQGEKEVAAELVLIEIGSEVIDRSEVELELARLERGVKQRIDRLVHEYEERHAALASRRGAGERLEFPYGSLRPGQREIVEGIDRALASASHLLVEAPTGIGKTVAALYPALRYALQHEKRVFVLTAKTLQQSMATSVLEMLNKEESFHSLQLRAKAKMCANDEIICHEEYCQYARDYYAKLQSSQVVQHLRGDQTTLLPDPIFEAAQGAEVCPFEVSLELTCDAQVVVCDYNYAFDPYVGLTDFSGENDLSDVVLVIDEIHNLVERGRGYYSPSLTTGATRRVAEAMSGGEPIQRRIIALAHRLTALIESTTAQALEESGDARAAETMLPEDDLFALRVAFDELFIDYLEHRRDTSTFRANDPFVTLYFDLLRFLNGLVLADGPAFSQYATRTPDGAALHILCKDPSHQLGKLINRTHSVIGLSATLSPSDFYRDLLGFDRDRFEHMTVPSPFPAENRRLVIDDSVATTWRERPDNYDPIARRLGELATNVPGNCLALFPSYAFLDQVGRRLHVPGKRVLIQSRSDGDRERELLLDALRTSLAGDVLLLAVAGGVFAEGVDYPGDMLKAVAVVGPCLPAISLERELLKRYYEEQYERGFEYAFVVPGMTRVVQAAGRLIRSAEDSGVVALLDRRFLTPPYRHYLPADWSHGGSVEGLVGSPGGAAHEFFG